MAKIDHLTFISRLGQIILSAIVAGYGFSRSARILQNAAWLEIDVGIFSLFALLAKHVRRDDDHDSRPHLLITAVDAVAFAFSLTAPSLIAATSGGHWNIAPVTIGYFGTGLMLLTFARDVQQLRALHACSCSSGDPQKEGHAPPAYYSEKDALPDGDIKFEGDLKFDGKIRLDA